MRYKQEWKGRLRVVDGSRVFWDGQEVGRVASETSPGAKSPRGMVTDKVWRAQRFGQEHNAQRYASMELAIEAILQG
jgi:hypothetical protein